MKTVLVIALMLLVGGALLLDVVHGEETEEKFVPLKERFGEIADWDEDFMDEYVQDDPGESIDVRGPVDVHDQYVPIEEEEGNAEIVVEKHPMRDLQDSVEDTEYDDSAEPLEDHDLEYEHESEAKDYSVEDWDGMGHFVGGHSDSQRKKLGSLKGRLRLTEGIVKRKGIKTGSMLVLPSGIFKVNSLQHDDEHNIFLADCEPSTLDQVINNADFTYKSERIPFDKLETPDGKVWDLHALSEEDVAKLSDTMKDIKIEEAESKLDNAQDELMDQFEDHVERTDRKLERFSSLRDAHRDYVADIRDHMKKGLDHTRKLVLDRIHQSASEDNLVSDAELDEDVDRFLRKFFKKVGKAVKRGWNKFKKGVRKIGKAILRGLKKIGRAIGKVFVKIGKALRKLGKMIVKMAVKIIKKIFSAIVAIGKMIRLFFQAFKKAVIKVHKHIFHIKHSWSGKTLFNVTKQWTSGHKQFTFNAVAKLEQADISLGPGLTLDGLIVKFKLQHFKGSIWGKAELLLKAIARVSAVGAYHRIKPIFSKNWHKGFKIGPVPIYFRLEFKFSIGMVLRVDGYVQLTLSYSLRYLIEVGAMYKRGKGWKPFFKKELKKKYTPPTLNFCINAFAEAFLRPQIGLFLFRVVGPVFMLEPYLNFEFMGDGRNHCKGKKVVLPPAKKEPGLMKTLAGMAKNALVNAGKQKLGLTDSDFSGKGINLQHVASENQVAQDILSDPVYHQHLQKDIFKQFADAGHTEVTDSDCDIKSEKSQSESDSDSEDEGLDDVEGLMPKVKDDSNAPQSLELDQETWGRKARRRRRKRRARRRARRVRRRVKRKRRKSKPKPRRRRRRRRKWGRKRKARRRKRRKWGRKRKGRRRRRRKWGRKRKGRRRRGWGRRRRRWGRRRRRRWGRRRRRGKEDGGEINTKFKKTKRWKLNNTMLTKVPKEFNKVQTKKAGHHPSYWAFRIGIRAIIGFELSFFNRTVASWRKKLFDKFKPVLHGCLNMRMRCLKTPPVLPGMEHAAYTGEKLPKWEKKHLDFLLARYGSKLTQIRTHLVKTIKERHPQAWKVWEKFRSRFDRCSKWETEKKCAEYKRVGQAGTCSPGPKVKTTCKTWTKKRSDKCTKFCDSPCKEVTVPPNPECKRWETERKCGSWRTEGSPPVCRAGEQIKDGCETWTQRQSTTCKRWCDKPCQTVRDPYQECAERTPERVCTRRSIQGDAPRCQTGPPIKTTCGRLTERQTTRCKQFCRHPCRTVTRWTEVWAEPHIMTLDGHGYTLSEAGDFLLLKVLNTPVGQEFQIQARSQPVHHNGKRLPGTSFTSAAIQTGTDKIELYSNPQIAKINGVIVKSSSPWEFMGKKLASGTMLTRNGPHELSIVTEHHGAIMVKWMEAKRGTETSHFLDINIRLGSTVGGTIGLLGNNNQQLGDYKPETKLGELRVIEVGGTAVPGFATIPTLFTVPYHVPKGYKAWSDKEYKSYAATRGKLAEKLCKQAGLIGYRLRACKYDIIITGAGDYARVEADARAQFYHDINQFGWGGLSDDLRQVIREKILREHGSQRAPKVATVQDEDSDEDSEGDEDTGTPTNWTPPNNLQHVMCRGYSNPRGLQVIDCPTEYCTNDNSPNYCRGGEVRYDTQGRGWRIRKMKTQVTQCPNPPQDQYCCGGYQKEYVQPCLQWNYRAGERVCTPDTRREVCLNWQTNERCVRMETKYRERQVCPTPPRECCGGYDMVNAEPCLKWKMKDGQQVCTPDTRKQVCARWDETKKCVEKNPSTTKKECPQPPNDKYCCGEYETVDSEPCVEWNYREGDKVCTPDTRKKVCARFTETKKCVGRTGWYHQWKQWYEKNKETIRKIQKVYVKTDSYLKTNVQLAKGRITWNGVTIDTNIKKETHKHPPKWQPPVKGKGKIKIKIKKKVKVKVIKFKPRLPRCPKRRVCKCPKGVKLRMELLKREERIRSMAKSIRNAETNPRIRKVENVKRRALRLKSISEKIKRDVGNKNKFRGAGKLLQAAKQYEKESKTLLKQVKETERKEKKAGKKTMRLAERKLHLRRAVKAAKGIKLKMKKIGCKCKLIRSCKARIQWRLKCPRPCHSLNALDQLMKKSSRFFRRRSRRKHKKVLLNLRAQWAKYVRKTVCKSCAILERKKKIPKAAKVLLKARCLASLKYRTMSGVCMRVRRLYDKIKKFTRIRVSRKRRRILVKLVTRTRSVASCLGCKVSLRAKIKRRVRIRKRRKRIRIRKRRKRIRIRKRRKRVIKVKRGKKPSKHTHTCYNRCCVPNLQMNIGLYPQ